MNEHTAIGHSDDGGKTVVFTCNLCPAWRRTFDLEKGTMKTENKTDIRHTGSFSAMPAALSVSAPERISKPNFCDN